MRPTKLARVEPEESRRRLVEARIVLLFSPELCVGSDPLEALEASLASVDVVQIRPKPLVAGLPTRAPASARDVHAWGLRVLDLLAAHPAREVLLVVDDRVDVAAVLADRGCAGVHLGQDDTPVEIAREFLGPDALIGLSTHDQGQIARAEAQPVDYLGFGPVHATRTKGYGRGLGAEAACAASRASSRPLFAIGGIDAQNVSALAPVGRIAVGSAILAAADPERAARELRAALLAGSGSR
jgi:thiamine-phosphate pyrophosphorylase